MCLRFHSAWLACLTTCCVLATGVSATEPVADRVPDAKTQAAFFENEVVPLLEAKCLRCHGGGDELQGGLDLTRRDAILEGGDSGFTIDTDNLSDSLLISAINYGDLEMPPTGKLAPAQIATLTKWVKLGLPWSEDGQPIEVEHEHAGPPAVNETTKAHWSFRPVERPELPEVERQQWVRTPVDRFVLRKLEEAGVAPNDPASKTAWLRRATYDLTGLPPTPEEIEAFLADESEAAYESVVDRLLESPHYGEKWGRFWLDLVRYAETNSFERDNPKPFVWRYRDYVIRSLNDDKPYDQFIREQLAGDELPGAGAEQIIATGYYRLGIWDDEPADPKLALYDELDDIVTTTGQVFLGLTVNCARCHDHKLDPIPQADYYRFVSFFRNVRRYGIRGDNTVREASLVNIQTDAQKAAFDGEVQKHREQLAEIEKQLRTIEAPAVAEFIPVEKEEFRYDGRRVDLLKKRVPKIISRQDFKRYQELRKRRDQLKRNPPKPLEVALAVTEHGSTAPPTHVLLRGNPHSEGDIVEPAFLEVLSPPEPEIPTLDPQAKSTGRRLALADWIASDENPLTARVMMNRVWQQHFGRGIVRSSSNFGLTGDTPTHPELLDWLAAEFVSGGWKLKRMHRLIMLSNTYRLSSADSKVASEVDSGNDLFWRFNPRRLSAEEIRDSVLAANGQLNREKRFGPSVFTKIPNEVLQGQSRPGAGWGQSSEEDRNRRTIYVHVKRSLIIPVMANFDGPEVDLTCPSRFTTTQPTQALYLLNSEFMQEEAGHFGDSLRQAADEPRAQVRLGLSRVMQRTPAAAEIDRGLKFLSGLQDEHGLAADEALDVYCLLLLNLNEFLYLD